ncbi:hypothetical protein S7335_1295 [Synechococcus sp. PCC 7335]|uniref:hypothetical protein n=1 Tax=Synechococcus sp. (strain ATCC 29403 / PCC 7335) TaxID=91464 RepID=UPI00017EE847|nr:hypothetical protein [Synechococcus sp. PCC 7335]EDX82591.1 hypothetical protein S7335_1295 [Synechococcus sp. PCC 7335]
MTVEMKTHELDWDYILNEYGQSTKAAIITLLSEAQISENSPAAAVIVAAFIAQLDASKNQLLSSEVGSSAITTSSVEAKRIDWMRIIKDYGPGCMVAISELLASAQVEPNHPAAVVIAELFIAQVDTHRPYLMPKAMLN